jgi:hypothetical protein
MDPSVVALDMAGAELDVNVETEGKVDEEEADESVAFAIRRSLPRPLMPLLEFL